MTSERKESGANADDLCDPASVPEGVKRVMHRTFDFEPYEARKRATRPPAAEQRERDQPPEARAPESLQTSSAPASPAPKASVSDAIENEEVQVNANATTADIVAEIERNFGLPTLTWEDKGACRKLLAGFVESSPPRDYLDQMMVHKMVAAAWIGRRLLRHQNLAIEGQAVTIIKQQLKRKKLGEEKLRRKDEHEALMKKEGKELSAEALRHFELELATEDLVEDMDNLLVGIDDYAQSRAMAQALPIVSQFDELRATEDRRFLDSFQLRAHYRESLPSPRTGPAVIEGEFEVRPIDVAPEDVKLVPIDVAADEPVAPPASEKDK